MSLKISTQEREIGSFRIIPTGPIDTETYSILERALKPVLASSPKVVIFDMGGVTYISSMGLGAILKAKTTLEKMQGLLIITNLQPQVKKVFDVVRSLPDLDIFKDLAEADAYFNSIQRKELNKDSGF